MRSDAEPTKCEQTSLHAMAEGQIVDPVFRFPQSRRNECCELGLEYGSSLVDNSIFDDELHVLAIPVEPNSIALPHQW